MTFIFILYLTDNNRVSDKYVWFHFLAAFLYRLILELFTRVNNQLFLLFKEYLSFTKSNFKFIAFEVGILPLILNKYCIKYGWLSENFFREYYSLKISCFIIYTLLVILITFVISFQICFGLDSAIVVKIKYQVGT